MHSLRTLHSQIDEELNINNSDSVFDTLYYTDIINEQRSLLIRNEYNKKRKIDSDVEQSFCIDVEFVESHNCLCENIPSDCKILRTVSKIPTTIELHHKNTITSVGPIFINKKRFNLIDYNRVPYIGNGRTTKNSIYAFLYDQYIYIISKNPNLINLLKKILIKGIFEDPTSLSEFLNCNTNQACWSPDDKYPMKLWMWVYMKDGIIQRLLRKKQIPQDDNNNANDDLTDIKGTTEK